MVNKSNIDEEVNETEEESKVVAPEHIDKISNLAKNMVSQVKVLIQK